MKRYNIERIGKFVRIFKRDERKESSYYASWTKDCEQFYQSLKASNKIEARKKAEEIDFALSENEITVIDRPETIAEATDQYINYLKSEDRSPGTIKNYKPVLNNFSKFCKENKVEKPEDLCQRLLNKFRIQKQEVISNSTRYHHSMIITQFGKYLFENQILSQKPFAMTKIKRPKKKSHPWFTLDEVEEILKRAKPGEREVFEVLAFTGFRISELSFLEWDNVDLDSEELLVRQKPNFRIKNETEREIPIHDRVKMVLEKLPKNSNWVFTAGPSKKYPNGNGQIKERRWLTKIKRICNEMGIEGCLHSFRHFFASHMANEGVPPLTLMKWLGHSDLDMITKTYYHLGKKESKNAMKEVCKRIPSSPKDPT